ncbi:nitrate reductase cytochrome c-type subunit [Roseateles sp.]|uniref:nitrate reductase cytochrome c-type subunit n=1 Tax=Roseateles sp. TaxID=1971397 RepID=UPI00393FAFD9
MNFPTLLKRLAPVLLALGLFAVGIDQARAADKPASAAPVKLEGLRNGTPLNQDNPPGNFRQERDHPVSERDFVQQPPLIPHTISGYQITKNFNKCLDCHAWQKTKESGATKISVTHFKSRDGVELDKVSPRRYFCTQCHVPQSDAKPLVPNTFERAKGMQ